MTLQRSLETINTTSELIRHMSKLSYSFMGLQKAVAGLLVNVKRLHFKEGVIKTIPPEAIVEDDEPMTVDHPLATQEVNGCKALLLEIVRRAAYDWVLYRTSRRMQHKKLADDAYHWLFVEEPGHRYWIERNTNQKSITSFLAICELLDLDPQMVRDHVRTLTIKNVMSVGRPAEYRRALPVPPEE